MALEAVVFPQYPFAYSCKNLSFLSSLEEDRRNFGLGFSFLENDIWNVHPPSPVLLAGATSFNENAESSPEAETGASRSKKKRRRQKRNKNKKASENQRISHIAVERNRRRQMNDYLTVLRSLMPSSYVHKIDQASIVGGAISYVKELEHLLQLLEARKQMSHQFPFPFSGYGDNTAEEAAAANIAVTIVEAHVSLKVLSRRRPRQLLKMIVGLQSLRLTTLHLNLSAIDEMVLYSFSLKVEEDCQLVSVEKLAKAVNQMMRRIQEETGV